MNLKPKEYIGIGVLLVLLIYAYQKGLFSPDRGRKIDPNANAKDGSSPSLDQQKYENKAVSIHTSLQSYFMGIWGDLSTILKDLDGLTDADLIQTANAYASLYPNDDYPTLYSIINATTTNYFSDTYTLKYKVLERLKNLGL